MDYTIKIGGTEIVSKNDVDIRKVSIMSDSIDTQLQDRTTGVICRVEVSFVINNATKKWCHELLSWSFKKRSDLYRDVSILVEDTDETGNYITIRNIEIPKMFCEDCIEDYDHDRGDKRAGLFTIKMIQVGGDDMEKITSSN